MVEKVEHIHDIEVVRELEDYSKQFDRPKRLVLMYNRGNRFIVSRKCNTCDFREAVDLIKDME